MIESTIHSDKKSYYWRRKGDYILEKCKQNMYVEMMTVVYI